MSDIETASLADFGNCGRRTLARFIPFVCAGILLLLMAAINVQWLDVAGGRYRILAESFLSGRLDFVRQPLSGWGDTAPFHGRYYSPLGPLPALLAMPFVWLGVFHEGIFSLIISSLSFFLCFKLSRKYYNAEDSCWVALAFCFATSFIGVAFFPLANYTAHIVTVVFLFLAVIEFASRKSPWRIGAAIGLAMASRMPAGLNILFFVAAILFSTGALRDKLRAAVELIVPMALIASVLAAYNFARFGSPFESGYSFQITNWGTAYSSQSFSIFKVLPHLWNVMFALPDNHRGLATSVLLMSPYLFLLLRPARWNVIDKLIVADIVIVFLVLLAFRNIGFYQVGYRFSLDFLPFVFLLVVRGGARINGLVKLLILGSAVFDTYLAVNFITTAQQRILPTLIDF